MKRLMLTAALAVFFTLGDGVGLGAQAQVTEEFHTDTEGNCAGINEANIEAYLFLMYGELQVEKAPRNGGGDWLLFRNPTTHSWTLATRDAEQECAWAAGHGFEAEDIHFFIGRAQKRGTPL